MFNRRAHFATFRLVTALNVSLECLLLYLSPSVEKAARNVNKESKPNSNNKFHSAQLFHSNNMVAYIWSYELSH